MLTNCRRNWDAYTRSHPFGGASASRSSTPTRCRRGLIVMTESTSSLTRAVARQYDLFQSSLETLGRARKFLNYGFTVTGDEPMEERQQRLCLEVFRAAALDPTHLVLDVGFGSGEQDFLLTRTTRFDRLIGFNISDRQVRYANDRARAEGLDGKLTFRLGEAESLPGI